jgi:hypothetical protein
MLSNTPLAIREATIRWVASGNWKQYWVLNFNQTTVLWRAMHLLGEFFQRYDRECLGRNYARKPESRLIGIAFAENVSSNTHFNCFVETNPAYPTPELEARVAGCWRSTVRSGTVHVQSIYAIHGVVDYVTKQWRRRDDTKRMVHSQDFWPDDEYRRR